MLFYCKNCSFDATPYICLCKCAIDMEDICSFFLACNRVIKLLCVEYGIKGAPLRLLLSIRSLHLKQYSFVNSSMLRSGYSTLCDRDVNMCLVILHSMGLVDRKSLQRGQKVGDVYSLTGKGLNIAVRFETLVRSEMNLPSAE